MTQVSMDKLKKIEAFSDNYRDLLTVETLAFKKFGSWKKAKEDWWLALVFLFDRAFFQGRSDLLSSRFERATIKALERVLGDSTSDDKFGQYLRWLEREQWKRPGKLGFI